MTNSLLRDPVRERWQAVGAVLSFLYREAGAPNRRKKTTLWSGSMAELREGVRGVAEKPTLVPSDDDEMAELLRYARPTLRQHGWLMGAIDADSDVSIRTKPKGYRPKRGPNS